MIRCIALDDEPLALELLEDNIRRIPFFELVKGCRTVFEAMEVLQREKIDLLVLDIEMPGITGTKLLRSLPSRPMVIFITAYSQYALEGFELDVLDYLIKPVAFDRWVKAANKALEYHTVRSRPDAGGAGKTGEAGRVVDVDYLFVQSEYRLVKVEIDGIGYVEAINNYIKIHVSDGKPVLCRMALKAFEERLPAGRFIRVHKSYLVAVGKISTIDRDGLRVGDTEIPVSKTYREGLMKRVGGTGAV